MPESLPDSPARTERVHARYEVTIPVDCTTREAFISNYVSNISRGGLFLRSEDPLPLESEVSLVLRLPDAGLSIYAKGRVIWNYDIHRGTSKVVPGSGIRFTDMSAYDRTTLEAYIRGLEQRESPPPEPA